MTLRELRDKCADLLWPRICAVEGCGRPVDRPGRHVCSACFAAMPYHDHRGCSVCGTTAEADEPAAFVCESCRRHPPAFDLCRSALRHEFAGRQLVLDFKFRGRIWLTNDLVDLLEACAHAKLAVSEVDLVVPVPLYWRRKLARGFNQAELLAEGLARRLERRCLATALVRVRDTGHQARLDGNERRKNVKGAFKSRRPADVRGRTVLLVDDVSSTGSTLAECAAALKEAGAARVWCLTVSRSVLE